MSATKTTKQISVWSEDNWQGGENHPKWIVSVDTLNESGDNENSVTLATFSDGQRAEAVERAEAEATKRGLEVVEE